MEKTTRILVVDRSQFSRDALTRALQSLIPGAEVTACRSAGAALEELQSGAKFDLMTTSLALEDMDGLELIAALRNLGQRHNLPVVVVSAQMDNRATQISQIPEVSEYFDKSHGYHALLNFLRDFAERNFVSGRILFVEDDMVAAKRTQSLLEDHGFQVVHTSTAEEAESLIALRLQGDKDPSCHFDLVLTDFYLRGAKTAANLIHTIRVHLQLSEQQLPVLVITGSNDPERQVELFRAGANDFVTKPYIDQVLITRVRSLILVKKQYAQSLQQAKLSQLAQSIEAPKPPAA